MRVGSLRFDAESLPAHLLLGDCYRLEGKWTDAKQRFDYVLSKDPSMYQAHYNLGLLYYEAGENFPGITKLESLQRAQLELNTYRDQMGPRIAKDDPSVAYLTDFRLNAAAADYLAEHLRGVTTLVCESQYRAADAALAETAMHSTVAEVAALAARAGVGRLVLFHVSPRYLPDGLPAMLAEARAIFPNASFPDGWV